MKTMHCTQNNSISFILIFGLVFSPYALFAQEVPEAVPSAPVEDTSVSTVIEIPLVENMPSDMTQGVPTLTTTENHSPQNPDSEQQSADSSLIEDTSNPQEGTPPINTQASTTPIEIPADTSPSNIPQMSEDVTITEQIITPVTVIQTQEVSQPVEVFTDAQLEPEKKYTFTLDGTSIATKRVPDWTKDPSKKVVAQAHVYAVPTFTTDQKTGSLTVSGVCNDPYFVVLIYKGAQDYDTSPTSYIFNKAFDCVAGRYSYELDGLPDSIKQGVYYLLIGGQGDTGSWKPITALTPMNIDPASTP